MKHKVKIFQNKYSVESLEKEMNEWLEKCNNVSIIDIKYSISQGVTDHGAAYYNYSALVHYIGYMED